MMGGALLSRSLTRGKAPPTGLRGAGAVRAEAPGDAEDVNDDVGDEGGDEVDAAGPDASVLGPPR